MSRTTYAHPVDVIRKFDPTLRLSEVQNNELGPNGMEDIWAYLAEAESELERTSGHAWRETRVGPEPALYEHHEGDLRKYQEGVKLYLKHREVVPLDATEGDVLEVRNGSSWRNITGSTDRWELDSRLGILWLTEYNPTMNFGSDRDRAIRLSYRYGSLGGERTRGGQSTLSTALAEDDTTLDVANAARLPPDGLMLIDGTEYVEAESVSPSTDTVTLSRRGVRGTIQQDHDADSVVHYCPPVIRAGVAAKAAMEMVRTDDHMERLTQGDDSISKAQKADDLRSEWQNLLDREADVRMVG